MHLGILFKRNTDDLHSCLLWKAIVAEFFGTLLLVFVSTSVYLGDWRSAGEHGGSSIVQISLTFGLAKSISLWIIGPVSGGHINPAVTISMLLVRKITLVRAIMYVISQMIGAIAGAGLIYGKHQGRN